jgi:hypothetical protein
VTIVSDVLQLVVQLPHQFRGFHVHRVLFLETALFIPGDKVKKVHVADQVFQQEFVLLMIFQVIQPEVGKITHQDIAWKFLFFQPGEIVLGLLEGPVEIAPATFMLYQDIAFP